MKKISNNIKLRSFPDGILELIQTGENYTVIERVKHLGKADDIYTCVSTDKFISCYSPDVDIIQEQTGLYLKKKGLNVALPIMKSYGVFEMKDELTYEGEVFEEFDANYADVDLDLADASGQFSYVLLNRNFVARYLYNTMTIDGESIGEYYSILPKQFKLLKNLKDCHIRIVGNCLVASDMKDGLGQIVILKLFQNILNLRLIDKFFEKDEFCWFNAPEFSVKRLLLFAEMDSTFRLISDGDKLTIKIGSYEETFDVEGELKPFNQIFYINDLSNLFGRISIRDWSGTKYGISKKDNLTVLFTGGRA